MAINLVEHIGRGIGRVICAGSHRPNDREEVDVLLDWTVRETEAQSPIAISSKVRFSIIGVGLPRVGHRLLSVLEDVGPGASSITGSGFEPTAGRAFVPLKWR